MAQEMGSVKRHELEALVSRIEWLEEERRKNTATGSTLHQLVETQAKQIADQKNRISDLENRLIDLAGATKRIQLMDEAMQGFQTDIKGMIESGEQRTKFSVDEANRLRRVENEVLTREINSLRAEIKEFNKINTEMERRQA